MPAVATMNTVTFYDTKPYDREYFERATRAGQLRRHFREIRLTGETAASVDGSHADVNPSAHRANGEGVGEGRQHSLTTVQPRMSRAGKAIGLRRGFVAMLLASLFAATRAMGAAASSPAELVGHWQGITEILGSLKVGTYPSTVPADHQSVVLEIAASGVVTGRIGQAVFVQCAVQRNRGWLGRTLHVATDYIVRGVIEGKVTPNDPGGRREFTLPFNLVDEKIVGGIMLLPKRPLSRPLQLERTNRDASKR